MEKKNRGVLPISKILVAIDGSKPSMRALDMAISIAKLVKEMELNIILVVPYPVQYITGENPTGDMTLLLEGTFMGLSDTMQPLVYIKDGNKNYLINMLDIIYIETEGNLEKVENAKKMDYLV